MICMITRDFSVISMTSQASLSLTLPLTKVTHAQYRKRFRASYNEDLPAEKAPFSFDFATPALFEATIDRRLLR